MRALILVWSRFVQRLWGVPPSPSRLQPTALDGHRVSSVSPSVIALIGACLRNILIFSMLCGGGSWLSLQDWSIGDAVATRDAGGPGFKSRQASVLDLSWSADCKVFLSRSLGDSHCGSPLLLHRFDENGTDQSFSTQPVFTGEQFLWNAVLLPDASAVVFVGESNKVSRIEIKTGVRTDLLDVSGLGDDIPALAVSSDGSCLAIALNGELRLCNPLSGQELLRLPGRSSFVFDLIFCDNDRLIAAGCGDGTIRVWNRITGEVAHDFAGHWSTADCVRFVNGSRHLASVGIEVDDTLRLWDLESGRLIWKVSAGQMGLHALAISSDGHLAATGGLDREIVLWDLRERVRLRSFSGHAGTVRAIQFSPDGTTLTSASSDGTICVWDVDSTELLSSIDVATIACPPP